MSTDIETLAAKAERARAAYEKAQGAAEQARQDELNQQAERARLADVQTLALYSDEDYAQATEVAREELFRVIADSEIGRAWVAFQLAQLRHAHAAEYANSAASRLGRGPVPSRPTINAEPALLSSLVDRIALETNADELDARDEARQQAIVNGQG